MINVVIVGGELVDSNSRAKIDRLVEDGVVELSDNLPTGTKLDIKFDVTMNDNDELVVGKRGHHNNVVNYSGKKQRFHR